MPEQAERTARGHARQRIPAPPSGASSARLAAAARAASGHGLVARGYGRRDWLMRRLLAVGDSVWLAVAMVLALALGSAHGAHRASELLPYTLATLPAWVVLLKMYGLYERDTKRLSHTTLDDLPSLFHALLLGCLLMWCYFTALAPARPASTTILTFGALALLLALAGRALTRGCMARALPPERLLLIGTGEAAGALIAKMRARRRLRLEPVGAICEDEGAASAVGLRRLGSAESLERLPGLLAEHRIGRIVLADPKLEGQGLLEVLRVCKRMSVKVSLLPAGFGAMGPAVELDDVQGVTVLGVNPPVLSRSSRLVKRALDVAGAGALAISVAPVLALLAVAIKLDSRGPVLFRQQRIGQGGRRFRLLKLRTMVSDAESQREGLLAQSKDPGWLHLEHDPRVTRVGRLLRLTSLDELPQLLNVLKGDMSLVGPRPLVAEEDSMVEAWARGRLDLTPGITGLWQVLGRTSIPFEEMIRLDYLYVTNWSLWGDIRLILRTLPAVLRREGAN